MSEPTGDAEATGDAATPSKAKRGQRRGRNARRTAREADHGPAWLPELDRGIPYVDLLNDEQVERVHDETMRLLEEVGIDFRE